MSTSIRVALLATPVNFGGIERVNATMLQYMRSSVEFLPVLFTRTDTKERAFFERLQMLGMAHDTFYVNTSRPICFNPVRNVAETLAVLRRQRLDLIHSHGYRANLIAFVVSRCLGLPLVSTCHGFIPSSRRLRLYRGLDIFLLRHFTRVIAVSSQMRDELVANGVDARRIQVITNAIATVDDVSRETVRKQTRARIGIGWREFVFGYVGRLSEEKGLLYLLQAARQLSLPHGEWRILVVGDGSHRTALEHAVRQLGLDGKVIFAGFQSDTSAWYPAMDAFVLPSMMEGTPMSLLEAMAQRIPVIASAVGGVTAIVSDRENGLLVPPADPVKLADAMRTLAADPCLCRRISDGGIRSVRDNYDIGSWTRKVRDVYLETIREHRGTC